MADELSISFGLVEVGGYNLGYHMAIESTVRGKGELAQAGPSVELKDAPLGGVFKQAFTTLGAPFGALEGKSKDIALNDFNFLEPSVPIFSGSNLFDAQKIIDYILAKITAAQTTYDPLRSNSNSVVGTLLKAFGVAAPRFGQLSYDRNGNAYYTPGSRNILNVPGLISIGVDSSGNPDHGFHQLGPNPSLAGSVASNAVVA